MRARPGPAGRRHHPPNPYRNPLVVIPVSWNKPGPISLAKLLTLGNPENGGQNMATLDWSQCTVVESVPGRLNGAWVFLRLPGCRSPPSLKNLEAGATVDQIHGNG